MENSRPKILIATGIFPPQVGGPATYSKLLLDKLPAKGFDLRVVNFGEVLSQPKLIRHLSYFFKLLKHGIKADIIYAQDPVSVGLPALLAAKVLNKKFYLKIVGDYAWEQGTQRGGVKDSLDDFSIKHKGYSRLVQILKKVEFFVANGADKIVVPSNYLKNIVSNWGVDPRKITVIYNAFHSPNITLTKENLREKFGWKENTIISAGRLVPWKGFDILILLMREIENAQLYIAGDGPERKNLENIIKKFNLQDRVALLGGISQKDLFEKIKAADVFVLNTSYEGLSHQLLEVMSLGTPIVTTTSGGNPETITNEESGLLVPYNDKEALKKSILRILDSEELQNKFVRNGIISLSKFEEEKMLQTLSDFFLA